MSRVWCVFNKYLNRGINKGMNHLPNQLLTSVPHTLPFMEGKEYLTWVRVHDPRQLGKQSQEAAPELKGPGPQKRPLGRGSSQRQKPSYIQPGEGSHPNPGKLRTRLPWHCPYQPHETLKPSRQGRSAWNGSEPAMGSVLRMALQTEPCSLRH